MTTIYGASDDLVIISGDISEEFDCFRTKVRMRASDGTYAAFIYNYGVWEILLVDKGTKFLKYEQNIGYEAGRHPDTDIPGYSDILVLDDGIEWVTLNGRKFRP